MHLTDPRVRSATRPDAIHALSFLFRAGRRDGRAIGCLSRGGGVALASEAGFHLLDITNEKALEHLGMEVTVMGTLDEATNTIEVTSIEASK